MTSIPFAASNATQTIQFDMQSFLFEALGQMARSMVSRIFLVLLLLCSKGQSVCFDHSGSSNFCPPAIFASDDCSEDPCQCPCEDGECEEHEIRLEPVLAESVKVPTEPCTIVSFAYLAQLERGIAHTAWADVDRRSFFGPEPDPGLLLRSALLAGVVLRL